MSEPVTYSGVLSARESTAIRVALLLDAERDCRGGTRKGRRALSSWQQAVLVLRWFLDATRVAQLATDNQIRPATAYRYLHEGIDVLTAVAPELEGALLAVRTAGYTHVQLDGTLVPTDRCSAPGAARADADKSPEINGATQPSWDGGFGSVGFGDLPHVGRG